MHKQKIAAIIPAHKEEKRIANVLIPLSKSKLINEIIVVDDGSEENIEDVVKRFKVRLIKNTKNLGKAYSMDVGVKNTDAEIILFCDADMKDLTPEMIDEMIESLLEKDYEMFLGLRNTWSNKKGIGLLSGLRVIKRELWERLPKFYKKGFRIETGLNGFSKNYSGKIFNYSQVIKEKKHGVLYGFYRRFFMGIDLFTAYCMVKVTSFRNGILGDGGVNLNQ